MFTLGIETFLAVMRSGSLSRAAEQLSVAQTTVSKRIKALEAEMDMQLIERGKGQRTLRLTPAGEEFCKLAEQWSVTLREARVLKSQGPRLSLAIGAVDSMNSFVLPPVYRALQKCRPPLKIRISTLHSEEMYAKVETGQLDIAFSLRERVHQNVVVTRFFSSPMVVLRTAAGAHRRELSPDALDPGEELFFAWGQTFETWHDQWWDPTAPSRIRVDSANLLFSLLQEPAQWAIVPRWIAEAAVARGGYVFQALQHDPPDYVCYRLTHKQPTRFAADAIAVFDRHCGSLLAAGGAGPNSRGATG